jgi:hypothetical protein
MLVESASAIFNTLRQGIPNIFPVSSPALPYSYRRVAPMGGDMGWVNGRGSAVFPLQSLALLKNGLRAIFELWVFAKQKPMDV